MKNVLDSFFKRQHFYVKSSAVNISMSKKLTSSIAQYRLWNFNIYILKSNKYH